MVWWLGGFVGDGWLSVMGTDLASQPFVRWLVGFGWLIGTWRNFIYNNQTMKIYSHSMFFLSCAMLNTNALQ